jgi:hypothetical protein
VAVAKSIPILLKNSESFSIRLYIKMTATEALTPTRPPPLNRPRVNSRDIPRTYSGLYGEGDDLLPFELTRNPNTEWLTNKNGWVVLATYLSVIFMCHLIILTFCEFQIAWTVSHTIHFLVSMLYIHWIKGSPNFYEQGEMNGMTTWEQLESTKDTSNAKRALFLVPTVLCYLACHFADYDLDVVLWNVGVWCVCILYKLPCMNGVRVLGINRTTGIDDFYR